MTRILLNPTFLIETGELLSHDGEFHVEHIPIRMDRSIQQRAKAGASAATGEAGGFGMQAKQIGSTLIPGLERQATTPTGYSPLEKGRMRTAVGESLGGTAADIGGQATLAAARTRNAGGFAPALAEAARIKSRATATGNLGIESEDARLAQEKQRYAQQALQGLYGTDTSNQLNAMGLSNESLKTALQAGQSGWFQNLMKGLEVGGNLGLRAMGKPS